MYDTIHEIIRGTEFSVSESFSIEGRQAHYESIPPFLFSSHVGNYLKQQYATGLWSHQSRALEILGNGQNLVISTGTASGKSLVFRSLALHKILCDPSSKVAVFYPLRALVADQLRGWRIMANDLGLNENVIGQIDGTVPVQDRDAILKQARIVIMTPDVCHAWLMSRLAMPAIKEFVSTLSTIVVDEAHTLEGVFGSNFAFLTRRLVAARNHLLGNNSTEDVLQFVAATATIANPREHLKQITGMDFSVINHDDDGAPHHERIVAHIASPEGEELHIAKELQRRVLSGGSEGSFITFVDSRKGVETLAIATQEEVEELTQDPEVAPYRAGFTPHERRHIEDRLRSGHLRGVVSTSALELGIDLPSLSVGFNIGIPSTRKAYRQRLGRVGRSGPGGFIIIGPPDAFRRYGTSFREYHEMSVEPSHMYLDNRFMQFAHGRCLAVEREALAAPARLPTRIQWPSGFGEIYQAARPGGNRPTEFDGIAGIGDDTPHRGYPLRNVGETDFQIKRHQDGDSLGQVSQSQALRECYPGATYLHNARAYEVLAWHTSGTSEPFVRVRNTSPQRLTRPQITTWVNAAISASDVIQGHFIKGDNGFLAECQMQVTERIEGYFDRQGRFQSYRELQQQNPNMRARSRNFRTSGVVLCIDTDWFRTYGVKHLVSEKLRDIFAHEYSIMSQDISSAATNISVRGLEGRTPRGAYIAVFDNTYGSLRFTEKLYLEFEHILERLMVAAETDASQGTEGLQEIIAQVSKEYSTFSPGTAVGAIADEIPTGYEHVFTPGSRVCLRRAGQISSEVEIVMPTLMGGELMYQIRAEAPIGQRPILHWVKASDCEPSGDGESWSYGLWNRETQTYEDLSDDA